MTYQQSKQDNRQAVATYREQQAAQNAKQKLQEIGLSAEQIDIQFQALDPNPPIKQTQAKSSAAGGAIAGSLLGSIVALLLNFGALQAVQTPSGSLSAAIALGAGVGAAAGGLMGGLTGINVPGARTTEDRDRLTKRYMITVQGTEDEVFRATEFLRQNSVES